MAQTIKPLFIRLDNSGSTVNDIITAKQFDARSRFLGVILIDENGEPYNLEYHGVFFYALKPDGTEIRDVAKITDSKNGSAIIELTDQCLAVPGIIQAEVSIWLLEGDNPTSILTSLTFQINVEKTIRNDSAVQSTNEFNDLVELMRKYWEFYGLLRSISDRLGVPIKEYDTIFQLLSAETDIPEAIYQLLVEFSNSMNITLNDLINSISDIYDDINRIINMSNINRQVSWWTPGNYRWTVPSDCHQISVTACGGGGGGGSCNADNNIGAPAGGGGGGGDCIIDKIFSVTPNQLIDITIGAGGIGGIFTNSQTQGNGLTGGNTILSNIVTLIGGGGGTGGYTLSGPTHYRGMGGSKGGLGGGNGSNAGGTISAPNISGSGSGAGLGGSGGGTPILGGFITGINFNFAGSGGGSYGGGAGGSSFGGEDNHYYTSNGGYGLGGAGGNGGGSGTGAPLNININQAASGAYGAGGAGGIGYISSNSSTSPNPSPFYNGGNGGNGMCIIKW